jgi:hypothetical protein
MMCNRLRHRYELVGVSKDRGDTLAHFSASRHVGDDLEAAVVQALSDLPLEVAAQLSVEQHIRIGEDKFLPLFGWLWDVVNDKRGELKRVEVHFRGVFSSSVRALSRNSVRRASNAVTAAG